MTRASSRIDPDIRIRAYLPRPPRSRSRTRPLPAVMAGLVLALGLSLEPVLAAPAAPRIGDPGMLEPHTASLLVDYFETYLRDHDIDAFQQNVSLRYTEGTLARLLKSGGVRARRAAVLALGLIGSFQVNEAVAGALSDEDPTVRTLAESALWAIWFRADSPENNRTLETIRDLNTRRRYEAAIELATELIARAPQFAEAYNQRAIALFYAGRFEQSAADCRRVLERNPYHIGALGGLAQCYMRLGQRRQALETYRRALAIQPHDTDLREFVEALESEERR